MKATRFFTLNVTITITTLFLLLGSKKPLIPFVSAWSSVPSSFYAIRSSSSSLPLHRIISLRDISESIISDNPLGRDESLWKAEGEKIIINAAMEAGARAEQLSIEWKAGRIIVTVDGAACLSAIQGDEEDEDIVEYDDDRLDQTVIEKFEQEFEKADAADVNEKDGDDVTDVVSISRAINAAFKDAGEGSVGFSIAVHHEIEVTTPGASDELSGVMFNSYKGFNVIVTAKDAKTGKKKVIEGKLVERSDDITIINVKGRMRKIKNPTIESVKLPKAKKEKRNR